MAKKSKHIILEFNEYSDVPGLGIQQSAINPAQDPSISMGAYTTYRNNVNGAIARIDAVMRQIRSQSAFANVLSHISVQDIDIKDLRIVRILKSQDFDYIAHITFMLNDEEFWGTVSNLNTATPVVKSECTVRFDNPYKPEWGIRFRGIILESILNWLSPNRGEYVCLAEKIKCYDKIEGREFYIRKKQRINVLRVDGCVIEIQYKDKSYKLIDDEYIYFNYRFEMIDENQ
jgi:hypothetical protein